MKDNWPVIFLSYKTLSVFIIKVMLLSYNELENVFYFLEEIVEN